MKNILLLLCCHLCLYYSCNSPPKTASLFLENFTSSPDLTFTILDTTDQVVDFIPSMVKIKDNLIFSQFSGDTVFTGINLTDYHKFYFGQRGRGKNEFTEGYGLEKINDSTLFIFDRTLSKLVKLQFSPDSVIYLPTQSTTQFMLDVHYGNDSIYLVTATDNLETNYALYNSFSHTLQPFIPYPEGVNDEFSPNGKSRIYHSHIIRHPSTGRYMAFKERHPIIDILEIKENSLVLKKRNIFNHYKWKQENGVYLPLDKSIPQRIFTDKLVSLSQCACALYKEKNTEYILTFDWEGNPLRSYKIPYHLLNFTGDDSMNFYGIALIGEKYNLIHFKL